MVSSSELSFVRCASSDSISLFSEFSRVFMPHTTLGRLGTEHPPLILEACPFLNFIPAFFERLPREATPNLHPFKKLCFVRKQQGAICWFRRRQVPGKPQPMDLCSEKLSLAMR